MSKESAGRIQSQEEAQIIASAEKPLRDEARKEGASIEGREAIDAMAVSEGDKKMEEKSFVGRANINGIDIRVSWVDYQPEEGENEEEAQAYEIYLPGAINSQYETMRIGKDRDIAEKVFKYAEQLARRGAGILYIAEEVSTYIDNLTHPNRIRWSPK